VVSSWELLGFIRTQKEKLVWVLRKHQKPYGKCVGPWAKELVVRFEGFVMVRAELACCQIASTRLLTCALEARPQGMRPRNLELLSACLTVTDTATANPNPFSFRLESVPCLNDIHLFHVVENLEHSAAAWTLCSALFREV